MMSPGKKGGGRTAPVRYRKDSYMKFGHFCVVPEGKVRLSVQGEGFRLTVRKNHESGNPDDILNFIVIVL